eukprot:23865-Pelagomonas_calceolata.AAC.1
MARGTGRCRVVNSAPLDPTSSRLSPAAFPTVPHSIAAAAAAAGASTCKAWQSKTRKQQQQWGGEQQGPECGNLIK